MFKQIAVYPDKEIQLIDITLSMFADPVFYLMSNLRQKSLSYRMNERLKFLSCPGTTKDADLGHREFVAALESAMGVSAPKKSTSAPAGSSHALSGADQEFVDLQEHERTSVLCGNCRAGLQPNRP